MNFADEFEKLMTDTGRRHASSPNEIVAAWEAFVAECTRGYGWGIYAGPSAHERAPRQGRQHSE